MSDTRLIEQWLPIAAIGEESVRERRIALSGNVLPPNNSLHVWWARRPLVASRAAILASVLPQDADRSTFVHALGIHGDPVKAKLAIELAKRKGEPLGDKAYGYKRAFRYTPSDDDLKWLREQVPSSVLVLDPTAGGGSIPFEGTRLGFNVVANDLNPVAALILRATVEWPRIFGRALHSELEAISDRFLAEVELKTRDLFPPTSDTEKGLAYIWARTLQCPYCQGTIPMSPHWRLNADGAGLHMDASTTGERICIFSVVEQAKQQSNGTVAGGDVTCPYADCGRVIDGTIVKQQAQSIGMGDQLCAVVVKERVTRKSKTGKNVDRWEVQFRAPSNIDLRAIKHAARQLLEATPEWESCDVIPTEKIPDSINDDRPIQYGMPYWKDLFSPRQLYCHATAVSVFRDLYQDSIKTSNNPDQTKAAFVYLSFAIDKLVDWNSRQCTWEIGKQRMAHTFHVHAFPLVSTYAEMPLAGVGGGFRWAVQQVRDCLSDLISLVRPDAGTGPGFQRTIEFSRAPVNSVRITCQSGASLESLSDETVDAIVLDPPYYNNVMYADLSDFFYVWLKRTAGHVVPDFFRLRLTDKENEAVANTAKFDGAAGAGALAAKDYRERMQSIFAECRRVLKRNGIMTLMFTHKATGAWDALTKGLIEAGFTITASWPVNTEAETSLHIKNKAAANSTIFLVCRPKELKDGAGEQVYWEDIEPLVASAVRRNVERFQASGIAGVDLYLASFGPALEEFSKHWPLKRGTPRAKPDERKRRRQSEMFDEEFDPYAVTPEDALDAARREVKRWKLEQLTHMKANAELDAVTSWFVLAWDAFRAAAFDYDEALRLARAIGVDLDKDIIGWLAEKKGSNVRLWDSAIRAAKGALGPPDGSRAMIDAIHHASHIARTRNLDAARELLDHNHVDRDPKFFASLEAVLEVLPVSAAFSGIDLEGDAAAQGSDFEVLENLRRLAYSDRVDEPKQLDLWREGSAA